MKKLILILSASALYILLISVFFDFYLADVFNTYSKSALSSGQFVRAEEYSKKAIGRNPREPSYHRQRAKLLLALSGLQIEDENDDLKREILGELEKSQKLNEKNLTTLRNIIPLYYFLALDDLAGAGDSGNIDEQYLPVTADYYRQLKNTYDNDLGIIADVAEYEKKLSLGDDYQQSLEMVKNLRPEILDWHEAFR